MAYEKLFEPGRIGGLTIRNRAVMSPMGTDLADIRGNATPRLIAYYTERAKGGIGLIINEYTGVDDVATVSDYLTEHGYELLSAQAEMVPQNYITLTDEKDIKNMQRMLDMFEDNDDVQNVWHNCENI